MCEVVQCWIGIRFLTYEIGSGIRKKFKSIYNGNIGIGVEIEIT
jgi:hypothetical protein